MSAAGVSTKIERRHLERAAVVYVRQSTLAQVGEHVESTARQYAPIEPIGGWRKWPLSGRPSAWLIS